MIFYILSFARQIDLWYSFRVEIPTEKRVKRWALSMEELMSDPRGKICYRLYILG